MNIVRMRHAKTNRNLNFKITALIEKFECLRVNMVISTDCVSVKHWAFEDIINIWLKVVINEEIGVCCPRRFRKPRMRAPLPSPLLQAFEFLLMIFSVSDPANF